jgi:hypothetical protein
MYRSQEVKTGRAYLLAKIDTRGYPHIDHVRIYSERHPTTLGSEAYSLILEVTGDTYAEASNTLERIVMEHTHYNWVIPLMYKR